MLHGRFICLLEPLRFGPRSHECFRCLAGFDPQWEPLWGRVRTVVGECCIVVVSAAPLHVALVREAVAVFLLAAGFPVSTRDAWRVQTSRPPVRGKCCELLGWDLQSLRLRASVIAEVHERILSGRMR